MFAKNHFLAFFIVIISLNLNLVLAGGFVSTPEQAKKGGVTFWYATGKGGNHDDVDLYFAANEVRQQLEPLVRAARVNPPNAIAAMLDGEKKLLVVATVSVNAGGHGGGSASDYPHAEINCLDIFKSHGLDAEGGSVITIDPHGDIKPACYGDGGGCQVRLQREAVKDVGSDSRRKAAVEAALKSGSSSPKSGGRQSPRPGQSSPKSGSRSGSRPRSLPDDNEIWARDELQDLTVRDILNALDRGLQARQKMQRRAILEDQFLEDVHSREEPFMYENLYVRQDPFMYEELVYYLIRLAFLLRWV